MEKLSLDTIAKWQSAKATFVELQVEIEDRIDYILGTIFNAFDGCFDEWYFEGAPGEFEDDKGSIPSLDSKSMWFIELVGVDIDYDKVVIITKDGQTWHLGSGKFPTRWLMEDFEQELIDGKTCYQQKQQEKAKAHQDKLDKRDVLVESAKAKLTKDEWNALRSSLKKK